MAPDKFFDYERPRELDARGIRHVPVIVVGAGPVGLTMALDWAKRGHDVLVLTAADTLSEGSRAICFSKRTLEICDRLGLGDAVANKGVSWNVGKVFRRDGLLYEFNLLPEEGHCFPAFVNLQQYWFEHYQLAALATHRSAHDGCGAVDLRWSNHVIGVTAARDGVGITVQCPDGTYALSCDWLIACDGAASPVRKTMGLASEGQVFRDRFLIADVKIKGNPPSMRNERWFWFDPPFHRNQSALLHRQADDVWRLDFQLGWQADPDLERQPERVLPRVRAMLGDAVDFDLEWVSVYTFQCRRMERFAHGRVIFAGDAAHQVSPFGARGANSGIQDADNLGWKLDLVLRGLAPEALLSTYDDERIAAADENILNSTRSTDFITPKSDISRIFRDAVLELAANHPFARSLVNSGRLSVPTHYRASPLNTGDDTDWGSTLAASAPGSPARDAPVVVDGREGWLLRHLGRRFTVVLFAGGPLASDVIEDAARECTGLGVDIVVVARERQSVPTPATLLLDAQGLAFARYAPDGAATYLFRPDQHVAGRRLGHDVRWIASAMAKACMRDSQSGDSNGNAQRRSEPVAAR